MEYFIWFKNVKHVILYVKKYRTQNHMFYVFKSYEKVPNMGGVVDGWASSDAACQTGDLCSIPGPVQTYV
jgi:hypothetical protein